MSLSRTAKLIQFVNYRACSAGYRLLRAPGYVLCAQLLTHKRVCRGQDNHSGWASNPRQVSSAALTRSALCCCDLSPPKTDLVSSMYHEHHNMSGSGAHSYLRCDRHQYTQTTSTAQPCTPATHTHTHRSPYVRRFMAFDKHLNMVLGDSEELRKLPPKKGQDEVWPALPPCTRSLGCTPCRHTTAHTPCLPRRPAAGSCRFAASLW